MGAYRDQLLRETYGGKPLGFYEEKEELPSNFLTIFKLKFTICLFLFAGFAYLSLTDSSIYQITASEIVQAVTSEDLTLQLSNLSFSNLSSKFPLLQQQDSQIKEP